MLKAVVIVSAILAVLNSYLFTSLRHKLAPIPWAGVALGLLFVLFYLIQLVAPWFDWSRTPLEHSWSGPSYDLLVQSSYLALGLMSCLLVYTLCADLVWFLVHGFVPSGALRYVAYGLFVLVVGGTGVTVNAGLHEAGRTAVEKVDLLFKTLAPPFDGFKIAQISDLHVGPFLRRDFVQEVVDQVNALAPDVVVMTGDVADGNASALASAVAPLKALNAPFGKYYVTGNHEYYWGVNGWVEEMRKLGFHVMMNGAVTLDRDGGQLVIAGVPDLTAIRMDAPDKPDFVEAIKGTSELATRLLLAHQPKAWEAAKQAGFDAQISGHTHAGQYFPFTWIIRLFEPYTHGLYDLDGFKLYVNKGAGFWGPPLRTGGPGEITLLTLRRSE